jgi:hypothetical protein
VPSDGGIIVLGLRGHTLTVVASGLYVGRTATVTIEPCGRFECFARHPWARKIDLRSTPTRLAIPLPRRGARSLLYIRTLPFRLDGHSYEQGNLGYQLYWNGGRR